MDVACSTFLSSTAACDLDRWSEAATTNTQHTCYISCLDIYTVSQKNCATFIFTVTLANVGRFLKFFQCRNQKEMAHNKNEKFPTVA